MAKKNILALGALALLISGCATHMAEVMNGKLTSMMGRDISHAFTKLGIPDSESEVAGRKFYVWHTQRSGSYTLPQYNTGTIGGVTPFSFTTYTNHSYNYFCEIRIFVNSYDLMTTYDYEGNTGGCYKFYERLKE